MNENVDEEIGALLEGRLDLRGRTELLARLATDDADYEVFADTAAVLREAEEYESAENESAVDGEVVRETEALPLAGGHADEVFAVARTAEDGSVGPAPESGREAVAETKVIPLRPRRTSGWRSPAVRILAAAAALAAIGLVPVLRGRMIDRAWRNPERLAVLSWPGGAQLPDDWRPASIVTRGVPKTVPNAGVAAHVGALHVELEVAARASGPVDTATVAQLAREAAASLETAEEPGPDLATSFYLDIVRLTDWSRPSVLNQIASARAEIVRYVDPDYFAAGAWTEAARLAARRRYGAFFATPESRKAVGRTVTLPGLNDAAKKAANRVRAVTDQGKVQKWESLQQDLDDLQLEISR